MTETQPGSAASDEALLAAIAERRQDAAFMQRLRDRISEGIPIGSDACMREVEVTQGTVAERGVRLAEPVFLCLRPLPCDNPHHKPERTTHGTR